MPMPQLSPDTGRIKLLHICHQIQVGLNFYTAVTRYR
jgi:hypothetical protein